MPIRVDIITQERQVYSDDVDIVVAPGIEGELGILPNHAPLITTLGVGELRVRKEGVEENFAIGGGVLEVRPDKVIVLADSAESATEIDTTRAEEARERAEQVMRDGPPADPAAYAQLEAALRRSRVRLRVARRRRRGTGPGPMDMGGGEG
jgi:F-type H+-transporting ATPase subunit epsilon